MGWGTEIEEIPLADGATDAGRSSALDDDVSAVFLQYPNFLGTVEDLEALVPAAKAAGALVIVQCDPLPLGILKPPGEFGVDVAVGEGQSLGNRLDFGGPSFGFFAAQTPTSAACRVASRGRRPTSTAAAGSSSRCRPASSTSGARRRRTTSAPRRRSTRWRA